MSKKFWMPVRLESGSPARLSPVVSFGALAVLLVASACGGGTPPAEDPSGGEPAPVESESGAEEESAKEAPAAPESGSSEGAVESEWLSVGEITDAAVLSKLEVTWVGTGALVDLIFEGTGRAPVTKASLSEDGQRVFVEIYGVREVKAALPLVTGEGGNVIGKPKKIAEGPVADVGRYFLGDDSGVRIELALREKARIELKENDKARGVQLLVRAAK